MDEYCGALKNVFKSLSGAHMRFNKALDSGQSQRLKKKRQRLGEIVGDKRALATVLRFCIISRGGVESGQPSGGVLVPREQDHYRSFSRKPDGSGISARTGNRAYHIHSFNLNSQHLTRVRQEQYMSAFCFLDQRRFADEDYYQESHSKPLGHPADKQKAIFPMRLSPGGETANTA